MLIFLYVLSFFSPPAEADGTSSVDVGVPQHSHFDQIISNRGIQDSRSCSISSRHRLPSWRFDIEYGSRRRRRDGEGKYRRLR